MGGAKGDAGLLVPKVIDGEGHITRPIDCSLGLRAGSMG